MKPFLKAFSLSVKAYDPSNPLPKQLMEPNDPSRVRRFVASDDTVDRYAEVVLPAGIESDEYAKNPVIMAMHDYRAWPLGHAIALGNVGNQFLMDVEFDPADVDSEAEKVMRKIDLRTINACSIGFEPVQWVDQSNAGKDLAAAYPKARRIFTRTKLLELTICPIPANPNAVAAALQRDFSMRYAEENGESPNDTASGDNAILRAIAEATERLNQTIREI